MHIRLKPFMLRHVAAGLLAVTLLNGCYSTGVGVKVDWDDDHPPYARQNMPPAHAPAHGRRAQQRYRYYYYPDAAVYFDTGRGMYFYLVDGGWQVSVNLPQRLRIRLGEHVSLELDTAKPYSEYHYHVKRYPPGQWKKKHKKNKQHGKDKWDD